MNDVWLDLLLTYPLIRPAINYYPFMVSLDKCSGSCNVLSPKIYIPKETKNINVKSFNMITNKNEAKTMTKHISCHCKWKFNW